MTLTAEALERVHVAETTYTLLGQWLEAVRLSRRQMARDTCWLAGVSRTTWRRIVNGEARRLYRPVAEALAAYLDLDPATVELLVSLPADLDFAPSGNVGTAALKELREVSGPPLPLQTWIGVKRYPTIAWDRGCNSCPVLDPCRRDVLERGGFAWCEELLPVDLDVEEQTVSRASRTYQED